MRAKIKKTGEVIEIESVHKTYCDTTGHLWGAGEIEIIQDTDINWEQRRFELVKVAMQALIENFKTDKIQIDENELRKAIAEDAIALSDIIIEKLKSV